MNDKNLERIVELLQEILKWTKFAGAREVRTALMNILETDQKRLIYHLSDGEHGSVEVGKAANVSDSTVRRYWESWTRSGIVEPIKVQGGLRYRKSFELEDFGFMIRQTKTENSDTKSELENTNSPQGEKSDV